MSVQPDQPRAVEAPPKPEPDINYPIFVAEHDYVTQTVADDHLSFKKGDLMYVINADDANWWRARLIKDKGREGYIPSNYVAECKSLEEQE